MGRRRLHAGDASMTLGEVKCVADNVLVQVTKVEEEAASGIALAAGVSEQTRTTSGVVVKTGTNCRRWCQCTGTGRGRRESAKFKDYAGADIRLDGGDRIGGQRAGLAEARSGPLAIGQLPGVCDDAACDVSTSTSARPEVAATTAAGLRDRRPAPALVRCLGFTNEEAT